MERRSPEPRRRGNSVNEEFGGEVLVEEMGLVLGVVDDPPLPLKDLHEELLYRRHFLLLLLLLHGLAMRITRRESERERLEGGDGMDWRLARIGFQILA